MLKKSKSTIHPFFNQFRVLSSAAKAECLVRKFSSISTLAEYIYLIYALKGICIITLLVVSPNIWGEIVPHKVFGLDSRAIVLKKCTTALVPILSKLYNILLVFLAFRLVGNHLPRSFYIKTLLNLLLSRNIVLLGFYQILE